jgi:hypothetical protein
MFKFVGKTCAEKKALGTNEVTELEPLAAVL